MKKLVIVAIIVAALVAFYQLGGAEYLQPATYQALYAEQPTTTLAVYFVVYVAVTALSIPGAALMTLIAGAVFGLKTGLVLASFASTIGATLAFLSSRLLLRDWVENKFGNYLQRINDGIDKDGAFYLFSLRLIPVIPFFVINLAMGLTKLSTPAFYIASQLGMLAGTSVYVNAGAEIGQIDSLSVSGILKPSIIVAFALLALLPFIARAFMNFVVGGVRRRLAANKAYAPWAAQKPSTFDRNVIVIGAGSGGLVTSLIGATVKAKTTLIEKGAMGGDCLNTGCVPSKALIRAAKARHEILHADHFGLGIEGPVDVDFEKAMNHVRSTIKAIEPHDSVERYEGLGVEVIQGAAEVTSPWSVTVNGQTLTTRSIVLATGAEPFVPPIPGLNDIDYVTSDTVWELKSLPKRLLVVGGGPIGCELAQAFRRLGSEVAITDMAGRLVPREDEEVSALLEDVFRRDGIAIKTRFKTTGFVRDGDRQYAAVEAEDGTAEQLDFDVVLMAVGRKPRSKGYGFDALELETRRNGTLDVNEFLQTRFPNIYAVGDVTGPYQFTHTAAHQAWFAAVNSLFGFVRKFAADYSVIPWATFTDPEIARVGLSEQEARDQGIAYDVHRYDLDDLDRAIADHATEGFVKVLTVPGKDKILGVTIVGYKAGDIIAEYVLAMKHGLGLNKILGTIHIYPTMAEANKFVAGVWKRANAPEKLLDWVGKIHRWRLS
ncbi:MAG: FAD-dependent oxidoreductase [Pseudomonadota bacterium]